MSDKPMALYRHFACGFEYVQNDGDYEVFKGAEWLHLQHCRICNPMESKELETRLSVIALDDAATVHKKNQEYGESWCQRGGAQAFAVIWRKVDRIESILKMQGNHYDIFEAWQENPSNIRDDIVDLRQYLLLLEEYLTRTNEDSAGSPQAAKKPPTYPPGKRGQQEVDSSHPQAQGYVDQDR